MNYSIQSLNVGKPKTYTLHTKELKTGFIKSPVDTSVWLTKTGLEGDGQADRKNHGGEDKALLMYAYDHYSFWQERYKQPFEMPAFGENVTINGLKEDDVHIGDIYAVGEALIQVSQPRQPCYKIAEVHKLKDIPAAVTETGYSGYYFRVLQEGWVSPQDQLVLKEKDPNQITVAYVFQSLFHQKSNRERLEKILQVDTIATSLRKSLIKRLDRVVGK